MVEMADVHRVEEPTARKPHDCYECHGRIESGHTYKRVTTLFDGAWTTMKICEACWELGLKFDEWEYGLLSESVRSCGTPSPPEVVQYHARYYEALTRDASLKTAPFIMGKFGEQAKDLGFSYRRVAYALQEAAEMLHQLATDSETSA